MLLDLSMPESHGLDVLKQLRRDRPKVPVLILIVFQVLRTIAAGKSTRQIAVELGLSIKTVSTYRARVYEKLRWKTPSALAAYAVRNRVADSWPLAIPASRRPRY